MEANRDTNISSEKIWNFDVIDHKSFEKIISNKVDSDKRSNWSYKTIGDSVDLPVKQLNKGTLKGSTEENWIEIENIRRSYFDDSGTDGINIVDAKIFGYDGVYGMFSYEGNIESYVNEANKNGGIFFDVNTNRYIKICGVYNEEIYVDVTNYKNIYCVNVKWNYVADAHAYEKANVDVKVFAYDIVYFNSNSCVNIDHHKQCGTGDLDENRKCDDYYVSGNIQCFVNGRNNGHCGVENVDGNKQVHVDVNRTTPFEDNIHNVYEHNLYETSRAKVSTAFETPNIWSSANILNPNTYFNSFEVNHFCDSSWDETSIFNSRLVYRSGSLVVLDITQRTGDLSFDLSEIVNAVLLYYKIPSMEIYDPYGIANSSDGDTKSVAYYSFDYVAQVFKIQGGYFKLIFDEATGYGDIVFFPGQKPNNVMNNEVGYNPLSNLKDACCLYPGSLDECYTQNVSNVEHSVNVEHFVNDDAQATNSMESFTNLKNSFSIKEKNTYTESQVSKANLAFKSSKNFKDDNYKTKVSGKEDISFSRNKKSKIPLRPLTLGDYFDASSLPTYKDKNNKHNAEKVLDDGKECNVVKLSIKNMRLKANEQPMQYSHEKVWNWLQSIEFDYEINCAVDKTNDLFKIKIDTEAESNKWRSAKDKTNVYESNLIKNEATWNLSFQNHTQANEATWKPANIIDQNYQQPIKSYLKNSSHRLNSILISKDVGDEIRLESGVQNGIISETLLDMRCKDIYFKSAGKSATSNETPATVSPQQINMGIDEAKFSLQRNLDRWIESRRESAIGTSINDKQDNEINFPRFDIASINECN